MKRLITITFLFFALTLSAKPRVTGGLSWGYLPQVYRSYSCAYYSGRDGYRINDSREGMRYVRNSYVLLDGGVDFLKHFSVHLQTGFRGVDVDYVVVPMNVDFKFFLKGYDRSGLFIGGMAGAALRCSGRYDRVSGKRAGAGTAAFNGDHGFYLQDRGCKLSPSARRQI